jgi:hypothetical protein
LIHNSLSLHPQKMSGKRCEFMSIPLISRTKEREKRKKTI